MKDNTHLKAKLVSDLVSLLLIATLFLRPSAIAQNTPANSPTPATPTTPALNLATPTPVIPPTSLKNPPNPDKPTEVAVGFYLTNLGRINQLDETFDINGYLSSTWQDQRLIFNPSVAGVPEMRYAPDEIWEPALTISNSQSGTKREKQEIAVQPNGTVTYSENISATVSSSLNLRKFPFDQQIVRITLESLSFDENLLVLKADPGLLGFNKKDDFVSLAEWTITGYDSTITSAKFEPENKNYSRYNFELKLQRNYQFYIFKIFIPLLLITFLSWASFWLDAKTTFSTQMSIGMTSTLTAITFNFTINSVLPRLPYLTLLDVYVLICYIFFFLAILANITVHFWLANHKESDFLEKVVPWLRRGFPLSFVICQGIAITIFGLL